MTPKTWAAALCAAALCMAPSQPFAANAPTYPDVSGRQTPAAGMVIVNSDGSLCSFLTGGNCVSADIGSGSTPGAYTVNGHLAGVQADLDTMVAGMSTPATVLTADATTTCTALDLSSTSNACVVALGAGQSVVTWNVTWVSGTTAATLAPQFSSDGGVTWAAQHCSFSGVKRSTLTTPLTGAAPVTCRVSAAGYNKVQLVVSAAQTGTVTILGTASTAPYTDPPKPLSHYHLAGGTTASTNCALVSASAGALNDIFAVNATGTTAVLKIYDTKTAPTAGSGTVLGAYLIPSDASGRGYEIPIPAAGDGLSSGLGYCVTGALADSDTASAPAGINIEMDWTAIS